MNRIHFILPGLALLLALAIPAQADELLIEGVKAAAGAHAPRSGLTMSQVREQFGNPVTEEPTVSVNGGPHQPPITRWNYSGYSVVFENEHVVHSVVQRPSGQ
jgi:hypothetical protein